MSRRAAIYIRTSSETPGEKSSPLEQEADCRHVAQEKAKVSQLQKDYAQMQHEELHLREELKRLDDDRQEFITKACKERMSDEEFSPQISALYEQERGVPRRLTVVCSEVGRTYTIYQICTRAR